MRGLLDTRLLCAVTSKLCPACTLLRLSLSSLVKSSSVVRTDLIVSRWTKQKMRWTKQQQIQGQDQCEKNNRIGRAWA